MDGAGGTAAATGEGETQIAGSESAMLGAARHGQTSPYTMNPSRLVQSASKPG